MVNGLDVDEQRVVIYTEQTHEGGPAAGALRMLSPRTAGWAGLGRSDLPSFLPMLGTRRFSLSASICRVVGQPGVMCMSEGGEGRRDIMGLQLLRGFCSSWHRLAGRRQASSPGGSPISPPRVLPPRPTARTGTFAASRSRLFSREKRHKQSRLLVTE